jgi:uncharacterized membrane protein YfcA
MLGLLFMNFDMSFLSTAVVIGFVIGVLTGVFGVGGGFLMTPALMIVLGIPGPIAVGTGIATIFANSSFGLIRRKGSGTIDYKLALIISVGSLVGVVIGSQLMDILKNIPKLMILGKEQNPVDYILLLLFLIILTFIAGYLYFDYTKNGGKAPDKRIGYFSKIKIPPYIHFKSLEKPELSLISLLLMGLLIGILIGLIGVGGGVILLPALIYLVGQRTSKAAGTSLALVWISSLVAIIRKGTGGDIDIELLFALLTGGIIGTFLGTKIGLKLSGPKTRLYFIYIVIVAVGLVGYKLYVITF